jgi:anti-sigma regulatory factor (Ser/Thr protein kinase)
MKSLSKKPAHAPKMVCGLYSKKEGASFISAGTSNLHSSSLGTKDSFARQTIEAIDHETIPKYAWELEKDSLETIITASADRHQKILEAAEQCGVANRRGMQEKFTSILEELVSNAIFHAYLGNDLEPKYKRRSQVILDPKEHIKIQYQGTGSGVFLQVTDQGGTLKLEDLSAAFKRCYGPKKQQIDSKEGGAGLGFYMIFEYATHFKIVTHLGQKTIISCWLTDHKSFDPDYFSFNFFQRTGK